MIDGPTRCRWFNAFKSRRGEIQFIDENNDYPNWVGCTYVIVKCLGQQCPLRPAFTLYKSLHESAPLCLGNNLNAHSGIHVYIGYYVFTQSGPLAAIDAQDD